MTGKAAIRACHVIHGLDRGGAEDVLVELAGAAESASIALTVVSLTPLDGAVNADRLRSLGVDVRGTSRTNRWDARGAAEAVSLISDACPQVVHTHLKHADLVGAVAARRLGVPHVSTLHVIEDDVRGLKRAKRRAAATVRTRLADHTIAVSAATLSWSADTLGRPRGSQSVLHNGVGEVAPFPPGTRERVRAELGLPSDAVVAAMAAIMRPGKGHLDLLHAVRDVLAGDDLWLVLAGDGPLEAELAAVVAADDVLRERVRLLGYRTDVPDLLHAADVVVHPTHADALPTALILALAASRPVVATHVGGVPEVVGDAGRLVAVGDVDGFADELRNLVRDAGLRDSLGRTGRRRFEQEFRSDVWARRLHELYAGLLRQSPRVTRRTRHDVRAVGQRRPGRLHDRGLPGPPVGLGAPAPPTRRTGP